MRRGREAAPGPTKAKRAPALKRVVRDRSRDDSDELDRGRLDPDLARAVGPAKVAKVEERLADATRAFRRERFDEARRLVKPLADQAPRSATVRELHGLVLYRLRRWREAVKELEAFRALTASVEQHPVLADAYRALGRYEAVDELWRELRDVSPSAELVAEGRIVAAGALADQGRLSDAIALLEAAKRPAKRPADHHLRVSYALADLYERAGEVPKARELFSRVAAVAPDFADVRSRLRSLG